MAQETGRDWMRTARLVALALAVVLLLVFIFENYRVVQVRMLFLSTDIQLAWALLTAALLGYVAGLLTPWLSR